MHDISVVIAVNLCDFVSQTKEVPFFYFSPKYLFFTRVETFSICALYLYLWSSLLTKESVVESLFRDEAEAGRSEAAAGAAAETTSGEAGAAGAFVAPAASAGAVAAETAATPPSSFPPFFSFFDLLRFNVTGKASRNKVR